MSIGRIPGASKVVVFAATSRGRLSPGVNVFTNDRSPTTNYARFTVSIPSSHRPGRIEWPNLSRNPADSFVTLSQAALSGPDFFEQVAAAGSEKEIGVYVHGYNNNFQEALFRWVQVSKDLRGVGIPVVFAWPSQSELGGYTSDKDAATFSRDSLVDLLENLAHKRKKGRVVVFAHSMGAWLTMEALRQLRLTGEDAVLDKLNVILAAPDIDVDVFIAQLKAIGPLKVPMVVLVSPDDGALRFSSLLGGNRRRVGAAEIKDPKVVAAAREARIAIVDISAIDASNSFNHDRFVNIPEAIGGRGSGALPTVKARLSEAGTFIFDPSLQGSDLLERIGAR